MTAPTYSLSWILPFVRQSLRGRGNFSYDDFVTGLWMQFEKLSIPGIFRTPPDQGYKLQMYDYGRAPHELKIATMEAWHYLLHNGFTIPEPPQDLPANPHQQVRYMLTSRGVEWAAGIEPLPEDIVGYMKLLTRLVPNLDSVIEQYIREGLSSFERHTYFAAAVMVGAAAEKAVYLLAESLLDAVKDLKRSEKLKTLMERRKLSDLFHTTEKTIHDAYLAKVLPHPLFDGAATHLMSLIEAVKVQRNDAVHPMNATVSPDSVRLSFNAFPHALEKLETLRAWFLANSKSI